MGGTRVRGTGKERNQTREREEKEERTVDGNEGKLGRGGE